MTSSAIFSEDKRYRYVLSRHWDTKGPVAMIIGLNPSTADAEHDDPTIRKCIKFAMRWGFGNLVVTNLFAFRATDPKDLLKATNPIGQANNNYLQEYGKQVDQIICAWGNLGSYMNRADEVMSFLQSTCAININKTGYPSHPLYLPDESDLIVYEI